MELMGPPPTVGTSRVTIKPKELEELSSEVMALTIYELLEK
jgi:hypothetical protein